VSKALDHGAIGTNLEGTEHAESHAAQSGKRSASAACDGDRMSTLEALDGADLVRYLFDRFATGDMAAAAAKWHDDARWHPVTTSGIDGFDEPRSRDDYFREILPTAFSMLPDYTYDVVAVEAYGPLVAAHIRSSWDEAGTTRKAEGLMVFRVVEGRVADLYVINAAGSGIF